MKRLLPLPLLLAVVLSAAASTAAWTYTPPASGTKGTISWTDSSGFENIMKGAVLSDGLITFATGSNTGNANLKNLDLSVPVYAEDGTTRYAFSPMALGDENLGGRIVSGATKTLLEHLTDIGTWQSNVTQYVTWWKDSEPPTLVLVK
jgi:hypothetical protein